MDANQDKLIGALIGLARATDGNAHLISESATAVVIQGLNALGESKDAVPEQLFDRVTEEKRKMVPDCFTCASPCGRTADYDMAKVRNASPEIRELKTRLLHHIRAMAAKPETGTYRNAEEFLYKALTVLGMDDFGPEMLSTTVQEAEKIMQGF